MWTAPQSKSALSSTNPPGWRPTALDHESSNSVLIEALADPTSSKDTIFPGTAAGAGESADSNDVTLAAGAGDSAEKTQMRRTTTDLPCLPDRGISGAKDVREPIASAGSQASPKLSAISESPESTQNTSKSTLTRISNTCDALDAAQCERDTPLGANPGDVNRDQRAHAGGTSSGFQTRTSYEGGDGDKYQEADGRDEEEGEARDRMSESDQEHEAGSEDEDEYDDDGNGEDDEEIDEENYREDNEKEQCLEGEADPVSKNNNQRQEKRDYGHTTSGEDPIKILSRPLPVGTLNSDNEALDEVIGVRHDTRNSTDAAHHSGSALSTAPVQRSNHHNRAVRKDKRLDVHAGQSVAGSMVLRPYQLRVLHAAGEATDP